MASGALKTVGKAAAERVAGSRPGPFRAIAAATVVGFASAAVTYRALRSGS